MSEIDKTSGNEHKVIANDVPIQGGQFGNNNFQINNFNYQYPNELVEEKLQEELLKFKQERFFLEPQQALEKTKVFYNNLVDGNFSSFKGNLRGVALAWCARSFSYKQLDLAKEALLAAERFSNSDEYNIAKAFITSAEGNKKEALSILDKIRRPLSNTAAYFIVKYHEKSKNALGWFFKTGLSFSVLDADGKYIFIFDLLIDYRWDEALQYIKEINKEELDKNPFLHRCIAVSHLVQVVPEEYRQSLLYEYIPISYISIADDKNSLEHREYAKDHFESLYDYAALHEFDHAASSALDYALWLRLQDPIERVIALKELVGSLEDEHDKLRRVPLALQFGIEIHLDVVEKEIEQAIVRSGNITLEIALARMAIIFNTKDPNAVVEYVVKYREQLYKYFDKNYIDILEIEALARSGATEQALSRLREISESGISEKEESNLISIINESLGIDPIDTLEKQFKESEELIYLIELTHRLKDKQNWKKLKHYAELLFSKTKSLPNAITFANTLYNNHELSELLKFIEKYPEFLEQSEQIQYLSALSLYSLGDLDKSKSVLDKIQGQNNRQNINDLYVFIAITSGDWESINSIIERIWDNRENENASSLLKTAQLIMDP